MNNTYQEPKKGNGDSKKIFTMLVLVLTLMVCTTGATYAYFMITAATDNSMTGTAASASLTFSQTPNYLGPTTTTAQSKPMVPQKSLNGSTNVLQKAFNGASGKGKCIDGNDNTICKAYSFIIKNESTATAVIKGQIKFTYSGTGATFANLKWKLMDSATAVTVATGNQGTTATTSFVNFDSSLSLAPSATKTYNIIFWIEETGSSQNTTDKGTWTATIQFINNTDGTGITSTIVS